MQITSERYAAVLWTQLYYNIIINTYLQLHKKFSGSLTVKSDSFSVNGMTVPLSYIKLMKVHRSMY